MAACLLRWDAFQVTFRRRRRTALFAALLASKAWLEDRHILIQTRYIDCIRLFLQCTSTRVLSVPQFRTNNSIAAAAGVYFAYLSMSALKTCVMLAALTLDGKGGRLFNGPQVSIVFTIAKRSEHGYSEIRRESGCGTGEIQHWDLD